MDRRRRGGLLPLLARSQGEARPRLLKGCAASPMPDAYAGFAGLNEADPLTGAPAQLTEVPVGRMRAQDLRHHVETNRPPRGRRSK